MIFWGSLCKEESEIMFFLKYVNLLNVEEYNSKTIMYYLYIEKINSQNGIICLQIRTIYFKI